MTANNKIRLVTPSDASALLDIYAPYVRDTAVSFEIEIPTVEEFARRIETISSKYPYLVYQTDSGIIAGYAYASQHRERAAYCYDADVSIYLLSQHHGTGIAAKLYSCLFDLLRTLGYHNLYAGYTIPNEKSRRFHEKMGFNVVGTYHKTGYKFARWHDVTWLEKTIAEHEESPFPVKSMSDILPAEINAILASYC